MRVLAAVLTLPALFLASGHRAPGGGGGIASPCEHLPAVHAPRARANENRTPAGIRRGDTLILSLVAVAAAWYPEAEDGCGLPALAFAESGGEPSIPGPLVRVPSGTVVHATVRNAAGRTLWLRGFHDHPAVAPEAVELEADSTHEFRFTATTPGTYAYGGTLVPRLLEGRVVRSVGAASQLVGAFVVDSTGAPEEPRDRVIVLTRWVVPDPADTLGPLLFGIAAVNGKSWPHTERLTYEVGDTVHWRVVNGSGAPHPMHLHGFYFRVHARGTYAGDTVLTRPRTVVTEGLIGGQTMRMSWVPERPGNWMFHCHILNHMTPDQRLDRMSDSARTALGMPATGMHRGNGAAHASHGAAHANHPAGAARANHALHGMAGLILGIHVHPPRGSGGWSEHDGAPRRTLRLFANQRAAVSGGLPAYGFVIQEGEGEPARDSVLIPGSPLVLRRGEPVQITVLNRLTIPLSVHWHGLELESFFDGVGDWSGREGRIAPPVAPEDSFMVRLTPPRAGTFMYHVHGEEGRELAYGLYAPLIVVDGEPAIDSSTDRILLVSDGGVRREDGVLVNGSRAPRLTLNAGRSHRLRIIGITSNLAADLVLMQGADTVRWRLLARDGAELDGGPEPLTAAYHRVVPGTIADYELTPRTMGELVLRVTPRVPPEVGPAGRARFERAWSVPLTVLAPPGR